MSTTQETTTVTTSSLLDELTELNNEYDKDPDVVLTRERALAVEQALDQLLTSDDGRVRFESGVRDASRAGRKTYRLRVGQNQTSWGFREALKFHGRYLLDLLNKSELLDMMQDWLDTNYRTESKRFRVFYHKLANTHNKFALTVSWDSSGFEEIDQIISHNREVTERRRREREVHREDGEERETRREDAGEEREDRRPQFRGGFRPRRDGDRGDRGDRGGRRGGRGGFRRNDRGFRSRGGDRGDRRYEGRTGGRNFGNFTNRRGDDRED